MPVYKVLSCANSCYDIRHGSTKNLADPAKEVEVTQDEEASCGKGYDARRSCSEKEEQQASLTTASQFICVSLPGEAGCSKIAI